MYCWPRYSIWISPFAVLFGEKKMAIILNIRVGVNSNRIFFDRDNDGSRQQQASKQPALHYRTNHALSHRASDNHPFREEESNDLLLVVQEDNIEKWRTLSYGPWHLSLPFLY